MATVKVEIYGASDDLVEVEGKIKGADEYSYADGTWKGVLEAPNGESALVFVDYRDNGFWTVSVTPYEEGYKVWPVEYAVIDANCRYSLTATVEVPEGTVFKSLSNEDEDED